MTLPQAIRRFRNECDWFLDSTLDGKVRLANARGDWFLSRLTERPFPLSSSATDARSFSQPLESPDVR